MKIAALILGLVLAALGTAMVLDWVSFRDREKVLDIGGLEASIERERRAPDGLGIGLIVVGAGLAVFGLVRKR